MYNVVHIGSYYMDLLDEGSNLLKIEDAARLLRVTHRTIYRKIWGGELPASKVGGLYYIRKEDIQKLLAKGQSSSSWGKNVHGETVTKLRCGSCLSEINDSQIAEICQEIGCQRIICTECQKMDIHFCAQHSPNRQKKWESARVRFSKGEINLLIKDSTARIREKILLNRIRSRLTEFTMIKHPQSHEVLSNLDWEKYSYEGDESFHVLDLLGQVALDKITLNSIPLNSYLIFKIPKKRRQKGLPIEVIIQNVSHIKTFLKDGFDTKTINAEELSSWLLRLSKDDISNQTYKFVIFASTTGWDSNAQQLIQGDGLEPSFIIPSSIIYLYDWDQKKLLYNQNDEQAKQYSRLFVPISESEELKEVILAVEKELLGYESLTLDMASRILPYSPELIEKAFVFLTENNQYSLETLPNDGKAILKR